LALHEFFSAETNSNADGIIQGLIDTELSNIGYLQSKALGRYLQYHRFSHIYSSDLKRASEVGSSFKKINYFKIF
jgi:broad specificity phosphatase PhoE